MNANRHSGNEGGSEDYNCPGSAKGGGGDRKRVPSTSAGVGGLGSRMMSRWTKGGVHSQEADTISRIYLDYQFRQATHFTALEEDQLRKNYVKIMKRRTWKEELVAVAETLINESNQKEGDLTDSPPLEESPKDLYTVMGGRQAPSANSHGAMNPSAFALNIDYGKVIYHFMLTRSPLVTIGRNPACDVVLHAPNPPWTCSRLHAVLYMIPQRRQIILADVGSYHGIRTLYRSDLNANCENSFPTHRRLLNFSFSERVSLRLGGERLTLSGASPLTTAGQSPALPPRPLRAACSATLPRYTSTPVRVQRPSSRPVSPDDVLRHSGFTHGPREAVLNAFQAPSRLLSSSCPDSITNAVMMMQLQKSRSSVPDPLTLQIPEDPALPGGGSWSEDSDSDEGDPISTASHAPLWPQNPSAGHSKRAACINWMRDSLKICPWKVH